MLARRTLGGPDLARRADRMVRTVFAGTAAIKRALITRRTSSGRVASKTHGVRSGRSFKLAADQIALGEACLMTARPFANRPSSSKAIVPRSTRRCPALPHRRSPHPLLPIAPRHRWYGDFPASGPSAPSPVQRRRHGARAPGDE